jgi:hypothetical protein
MAWNLAFSRNEYMNLSYGSRYPESEYSARMGRINLRVVRKAFEAQKVGKPYHVNTKVNQYVILHETSSKRSGNQMPRDASSSVRALDARSIGTSRTISAGRKMAKKIGTR